MSAAVLTRPTLVLNRNWQPVAVSTVSRALVLVWNGVARVVDPRDFQLYDWADWSQLQPDGEEPVIRTCRLQLRVPEVITLIFKIEPRGRSLNEVSGQELSAISPRPSPP